MARHEEPAPQLPQNIDAERSVLGAILTNESLYDSIQHLTPADFFHDHHRRIFTTIQTMRSQQRPVDLVTICEVMGAEQSLGLAGGVAYISTLMDGVPHVSNVAHYAAIVKEKSRLRAIIHQAQAMQRAAFEPSATADDIERLLHANTSALASSASS